MIDVCAKYHCRYCAAACALKKWITTKAFLRAVKIFLLHLLNFLSFVTIL